MDRELVLERMRREKIIAIVRGVETASIGEVALALAAGGITCMEITVDHRTKDGPEETYRSIAWLRERMGEAVCLVRFSMKKRRGGPWQPGRITSFPPAWTRG